MQRYAIIDLGSNTFQLLVVAIGNDSFSILAQESLPSKIAMGGISQQQILIEAINRAVAVLDIFKKTIEYHQVSPANVLAFGTSAIRNATNAEEFIATIWQKNGINIRVISGETEAGYIYKGVRLAVPMGNIPTLVMDIGGGSVEFIICSQKRVFWKQSFEIGGQRLMDKFITTDPISAASLQKMYEYLNEELLPLTNAVHQYAPEILLGSAGTFETLVDMYFMRSTAQYPPKTQIAFELPIAEFYRSYQQIMPATHAQRLAIAGMKSYRSDMIVVGICLTDFVLKNYAIETIKVSNYSLKEGVLADIIEKNYAKLL